MSEREKKEGEVSSYKKIRKRKEGGEKRGKEGRSGERDRLTFSEQIS